MLESFNQKINQMDIILRKNESFDIIRTSLQVAARQAAYYYVEGFVKVESLVKIHDTVIKINAEQLGQAGNNLFTFASLFIPHVSYRTTENLLDAADCVLKGMAVYIMEGFSDVLILDIRFYPSRETKEPEKNRTLRGPHEGFVENLLQNTVLIRRRLATSDLTFERFQIGEESKTDVVLAYMNNKVNQDVLHKVRTKICNLKLKSLTMSQETLSENFFFKDGFLPKLNPLPRVRYVERPDTAVAQLTEGKLLILVDTSPAVMVLPVCMYDFFEETEDYYFPPFTGSYLRIVRFIIFFASILLAPSWLLSFEYREMLPKVLSFLDVTTSYTLPIFIQLLILEFAIDGIKIASLNTPSTLSNSLSVVGGLLLGDFAVKAGWFVPDTILCAAFTALSNFIPTNYELGYSSKFARLLLIILVASFQLWGFIAGILIIIIVLCTTRTIEGKSYLYPVYPFNQKVFFRLFFRHTKGKEGN